MQEAFAEAVGGRKEEVRVTLAIEQLMQAERFTPDPVGDGELAPDFDTVPDGFSPIVGEAWTRLERPRQDQVLRWHVNWNGFNADQVARIVGNVLDGKPRSQWFDMAGV